jgi:creatinine amidohydrolase/Fe(II)-dependent formamide hydrolase-like protein
LTPYSAIDFRDPGPLLIALDFRRDSSEGVMGDPSLATHEKGRVIADAVVDELTRVVEAFAQAPLDGVAAAARIDS